MQPAEEQRRGTDRTPQWHESQPERLAEERALVESNYPDFRFSFDGKGNAQWEGDIKLDPTLGVCPFSIVPVRITCLPTYPRSVPYVKDVEGKLKDKNPHAEPSGRICLENRCTSDPACLYTENKRIWDTITSLHDFLLLHWRWVQEGIDFQGQLHGEFAFIEFELQNGCYPLEDYCLCGREAVSYKECCYPKVMKHIEQWQPKLTHQRGYERCNCGSGRTYRKCGGKKKCITGFRYCDKQNPHRQMFLKHMRLIRQQQEAFDRNKYR